MTYWVLQHPMMTFWWGVFAILVVDNIVASICNTVTNVHLIKENQHKSMSQINMQYKGYCANVEYDDVDKIWCGTIIDIEDGAPFYAATLDAAWAGFHNSVDNYLDALKQYNKT